MDVSNFIPNYPNIDDDLLQQKLLDKTEFEILDPSNQKVDETYFRFQRNLGRLLSPYTPPHRMLVDYKVGVGKCVHRDTLISLQDKKVKIKDLFKKYKGEQIDENWWYAKDLKVESYHHGIGIYPEKVTKFWTQLVPKSDLVKITTDKGYIIKTKNHKIFTDAGWKKHIEIGDRIINSKLTVDKVVDVKYYSEKELVQVYDLEVEKTHTYIANNMVTHNTCSAILVNELYKLIERGGFRQTYVITSGPSLEQNFKEQFIRKCPGIAKEFTFDNFVDKKGMAREIKQHFIFRKYGAFATYINGKTTFKEVRGKRVKFVKPAKTDEFIKRQYSNRIFILDEGQALKNRGPRYDALQRIFDVAENVTVLILSGTPITEHPIEGVSLINLLKPKKDRMIISDNAFLKKYYNGLKFDSSKEQELLDFYKGYVTYLKQTGDIEKARFIENSKYPNTFKDFKTYNVKMEKFQKDAYLKSLKEKKVYKKRDKKRKGNILGLFLTDDKGQKLEVVSKEGGAFDKEALSSSIFVYPDGTYGSDGFKKNMKIIDGRPRFKDKKMEKQVIENIGKYSTVFAKSFEIIKNNPDRVFYIYFDTLDIGVHIYGTLLELVLKFKYWDGKRSRFSCDKTRPTYTKITQQQTKSKEELQKLLDQIGRKENADGSCVRVVLGSPVSGVGLTIPTATRVMVIGSQVSPANITQIPARINRPGSLKWVKEAGLPVDTETYLFAAITGTNDKSIDLHIYTLAQNKLILNKPQYELFKRADPFCAISYARNVTSKKDNYVCAFSKKPGKDKRIWTYERDPDDKTDLLFWKQDEINNLKLKMIEKVKDFGTVNIVDFLDDYDPMIVYRAVKELSKERVEVETFMGEKGAIFIKGDLLFVDPTVSGDPNSAFYIQSQTFPTSISLYDVMSRTFMDDDYETIEDIVQGNNVKENFERLSKYSQNFLWEEAWKRKDTSEIMKEIADLKPVYEIDGEIYNVVWAEPIAYERSNAAVPIEDPTKIRVFRDGNWVYFGSRDLGSLYPPIDEEDIDEARRRKDRANRYKNQYKDIVRKINNSVTQEIKDFGEDNQYGFYGFIDPKTDKFKIVITGGRNKGKVCSPSFTKVEHMTFFKKLGILDKLWTDEFDDPKIKKVQAQMKKDISDEEIARKLITVKKFDVPDNFTRKDKIAAIYILLPGGIPEAKRCGMLEKAFRDNEIMKE
jgi:intein/homing endonuclease